MKESIPLSGKQMAFRQRRSSNSIVLLVLVFLIVISLFLLRSVIREDIKSPFAPTPIPTRTISSFALEGETHFTAGNLTKAIEAYQQATLQDPSNAELWYELARIQCYSSASLATDDERRLRLQDALKSIDTAVKIAPDSSSVHAIRAFILDWNAPVELAGDKSQQYLSEAEQAAVRAIQLDPNNALAQAYYAEILLDQLKWSQADQYITTALKLDPNLMDVHRIRAIVQETGGNYAEAINEYKKAAAIYPNLTFLYLRIGVNYRQLRQFDEAMRWFEKAVTINKQLNLNDPLPYLAIAKTQSQVGDFFNAARNVKAALKFNPNNPEVYGSLGLVYFKSRNYETAIFALQCAVRGCDAKTSCLASGKAESDCTGANVPNITVQGMPLSGSTVVYYYTYGSVLAGMHRKTQPYCDQAVQILHEVRQQFASDASVISIIASSEEICTSFGITYSGAP
jgi:tetratricopeptide (TPR) repeat protein